MDQSTGKSAAIIWQTAIDYLVSWILAVAFLLAGAAHWGNPYFFLGSVYAYQLSDAGTGQIVAMTLPLIQLGLAASLLLRLYIDAAHMGTLFLLMIFATVQTTAYLRELGISCGCFGAGSDEPIGWTSLSIVFGLLILSLARNLLVFQPFRSSTSIKSAETI